MKILMSVPSWPPGNVANGIVTYIGTLVPALRELGHHVYLLTGDAHGDDEWTINLRPYFDRMTISQRVARALNPGRAFFKNTKTAIRAAVEDAHSSINFDILELEESFGFSSSIAKRGILPVVIRLHGPWFLTKRFLPNIAGPVNDRRITEERRALAVAHGISSPSAAILQSVEAACRIPDIRATIPNPISTPSTSWDVGEAQPKSILFVGRFDLLKGGDLVIRAFGKLASEYSDVSLSFVGPDDGIKLENGELVNLETFVALHLPQPSVQRFSYLGPLGSTTIASLRAKHFITIVASRQEVMPYTVLEAMAFGAPTVVTNVGGIPELVEDGVNGLIVKPDAEQLAAACRRLLDEPGLAERLGRRAQRDTTVRHDPLAIARRTIDFYAKVTADFRRSAGAKI